MSASVVSTSISSQQSAAASLADSFKFYTVDVFDKFGDPRVAHYGWMRTPWPTIAVTFAYYIFVRHLGPALMKDRKPYKLLPLIRLYNLIMTAWNCFGFYTANQLTRYGYETLGCTPIDPHQRDERTLLQVYYGWMFYTSRLVEFADTIFFVLRKKDSQLSSFHVFHHSIVPTLTWFFLKFAPGGNSGIFPLLNTAIHTIMYGYYFLATFPAAHPFLWWKKYLTQLQIVQFLVIISVCMQPLFIPGCPFPRVLLFVSVAFSFVFIYLFVDFYLKSYNKAKLARDKLRASQMQLQKQKLALLNNGSADLSTAADQTTTSTSTSTTATSNANGGEVASLASTAAAAAGAASKAKLA